MSFWSDPRRRIVFCLILLLAILIRLVFFIGYQGHDDRTYIAYAYYFAQHNNIGSAHLADPWVTRMAAWLPIALCIKLLGTSQFAIVFYSFLCSIAGVILAFSLGEFLFDFETAALGALLLAFFPLDVLYASRAFADEAIGFFMVLAFFLFLYGEKKNNALLMFLGGASAGCAYLHKETAVLFFPPILLYLLFQRRIRLRSLAFPLIGFLFVASTELFFWKSQTGDPLYHYHALSAVHDYYVPPPPKHFTWDRILPGPKPDEIFRSHNNFLDALLMFLTHDEFGLLFYLVWPLTIWLSWKRDRVTQVLRLWFVPITLLLLFFPFQFPGYSVNRDPRYYTCISIPVLLLVASWLMRRRRVVRWCVAGALIVTWLPCVFLAWSSSRMSVERQVLGTMQHNPSARFWVSNRLAADVIILSRFDPSLNLGIYPLAEDIPPTTKKAEISGPIRVMRADTPVAETPDSVHSGYVILNQNRFRQAQPSWMLVKKIMPRLDAITSLAERILAACGVPARFVRKLSPSSGEWMEIYRVPGD